MAASIRMLRMQLAHRGERARREDGAEVDEHDFVGVAEDAGGDRGLQAGGQLGAVRLAGGRFADVERQQIDVDRSRRGSPLRRPAGLVRARLARRWWVGRRAGRPAAARESWRRPGSPMSCVPRARRPGRAAVVVQPSPACSELTPIKPPRPGSRPHRVSSDVGDVFVLVGVLFPERAADPRPAEGAESWSRAGRSARQRRRCEGARPR